MLLSVLHFVSGFFSTCDSFLCDRTLHTCASQREWNLSSTCLDRLTFFFCLGWQQDALAEVEEKYRKAMVSNAQLDNEKSNLMYQVDTLKDSLMELEEMLSESQRGYEDKVKVRQPRGL